MTICRLVRSLCLALFMAVPGFAQYSTDRDLPPGAMSARASEEERRFPAGAVLDGRPETCWVTTGTNVNPTLTINLGSAEFATPPAAAVTVAAIRVLPREKNIQTISRYSIYVSPDSMNGQDGTWTLIATGKWSYGEKRSQAENEKRAWFQPVAAKYLRVEAQGRGWFGISELRVERPGEGPAGEGPVTVPAITRPATAVDVTAPPPADVEAQARRFQERNSPEQVKRLATDFFAWLDLQHPDLREVNALYTAGKCAEALRAYRVFFLKQMRQCAAVWPMLEAFEYTNPGGNAAPVDELFFDVATYSNKKVALGGPGRVDWAFDPQMRYLDQFYPLLNAYLETGNQTYLDKWAAYADDLTMNHMDTRSAVDLGYNSDYQGVRGVAYLFRYFNWLALALPENGDGLPETTLARVLVKRVREYPPVSAIFSRANPQNHQMDVAEFLVTAGVLLDRVHFKIGAFYLQEGIRALAAYDTHCNYLDGTELQRDAWYNEMWLNNGALPAYRLLKTLCPERLTPVWDGWFRDSFKARATYLVRNHAPSGQLPLVLRNDGRTRIQADILDKVPDARQDANLAVILDVLTANSQNKTPATLPSFTSDAFPYGGFYLIRQGWGLADQQGTFFNAGRLSDGFRVRASNKFALHAFGEDLIIGGEQGAYSQIPAPLTVDGREQQSDFGILRFGHRRMYPRVSDRPSPFRWHCSARYDLVEGVYDGPYAACEWGTLNVVEAAKTRITGVTHQRQVHFLRRHGLWIVTDRVTSHDPHVYTQVWEFPVKPAMVACDPARSTLGAQVGTAAVTLHQFGSERLAYTVKESHQHFTYDKKPLPTFSSAQVSFAGAGTHTVVTVIYPRLASAAALTDIQPLTVGENAYGFSARTPDGATVRYLAAAEGAQQLTLDTLSGTAESLLLVRESDGSSSGMVLGGKSLSINGKAQSPGTPDAEFTIADDRLTTVAAICRPVEPVVIAPEAAVFTKQQSITLTCATPDVVIHYTLDGSDPTPASRRYRKPFSLAASATVKARAFRAGVTQVPDVMSGTLASAITRAEFAKEPLQKAVPAPAGIRPGLTYAYYEAPWKELFSVLDTLTPLKRGEVPSLFDISPRQTEQPFAFRYSGFLRVPATGVYTLHFPDEFCRFDLIAGYELRVRIDGRSCLPEARRHAHGTCSIALAKGLHSLVVDYLDLRGQNAPIKVGDNFYTLTFDRTGTVTGKARMNFPELSPERNLVWDGVAPQLEISGPGRARQPLPAAWLCH